MNPNGSRPQREGDRAPLNLETLVRVLRTPELRMNDVAGVDVLAEQLIVSPDDPYLQDVLSHIVEDQSRAALLSGDPFFGNPPPLGVLPALAPGRVLILQIPVGEVLTTTLDPPRNILLAGPTGQGKSTWLRSLLLAAMAAPPTLVLAFDRKPGELIDCRTLAQPGVPLLVLHWRQLQIALLQPPAGIEPIAFGNALVHLIARESHLFASRRLMLETLERLYRRPRALGTWPTLSAWMNVLDQIRVSAASRLGQYREAALYAMKQILLELGEVIDYAASDMLDRLLAYRGVVVIITEGLSSPMQALLASLFLNYAYRVRQSATDITALAPLYCVLDDALPLAFGNATAEAEGGISPLAEWCFMGRSRRMALIISAQNFSLLSPAIRMNTHATVCFGSYGRDAEEIARHMSLTREQADRLPFLVAGEAVARVAPWQAMYGRVPQLP